MKVYDKFNRGDSLVGIASISISYQSISFSLLSPSYGLARPNIHNSPHPPFEDRSPVERTQYPFSLQPYRSRSSPQAHYHNFSPSLAVRSSGITMYAPLASMRKAPAMTATPRQTQATSSSARWAPSKKPLLRPVAL